MCAKVIAFLIAISVACHASAARIVAAFGLKPDTPEPEIVAHLFKLYAEMTKEV